ncbi:hypothetical protein SAVIM338S_02831 [Streptomyces avidinii]
MDRLWPRGLSKEAARVDEWAKAVAPSTELRKWFHGGGSVEEFRARYSAELAAAEAVAEIERLRGLALGGPVTLLTAVRDPGAGHAGVLAALLS